MGGLHSHYIVKPNLVLRLGWGFDNRIARSLGGEGNRIVCSFGGKGIRLPVDETFVFF